MSDEETKVETPPAKPRKWLRRLRIAVSVFFGLLTVALCVLWVKSYFSGDFVYWNIQHHRSVLVGLSRGRAIAHTELFTIGKDRLQWMSSGRASIVFRWRGLPTSSRRIGNGFQIVIPGLFVVGATAVAFAATWPWYSLRFSLRTLLIATTLVAIVLGLGVWLASRV